MRRIKRQTQRTHRILHLARFAQTGRWRRRKEAQTLEVRLQVSVQLHLHRLHLVVSWVQRFSRQPAGEKNTRTTVSTQSQHFLRMKQSNQIKTFSTVRLVQKWVQFVLEDASSSLFCSASINRSTCSSLFLPWINQIGCSHCAWMNILKRGSKCDLLLVL